MLLLARKENIFRPDCHTYYEQTDIQLISEQEETSNQQDVYDFNLQRTYTNHILHMCYTTYSETKYK